MGIVIVLVVLGLLVLIFIMRRGGRISSTLESRNPEPRTLVIDSEPSRVAEATLSQKVDKIVLILEPPPPYQELIEIETNESHDGPASKDNEFT